MNQEPTNQVPLCQFTTHSAELWNEQIFNKWFSTLRPPKDSFIHKGDNMSTNQTRLPPSFLTSFSMYRMLPSLARSTASLVGMNTVSGPGPRRGRGAPQFCRQKTSHEPRSQESELLSFLPQTSIRVLTSTRDRIRLNRPSCLRISPTVLSANWSLKRKSSESNSAWVKVTDHVGKALDGHSSPKHLQVMEKYIPKINKEAVTEMCHMNRLKRHLKKLK